MSVTTLPRPTPVSGPRSNAAPAARSTVRQSAAGATAILTRIGAGWPAIPTVPMFPSVAARDGSTLGAASSGATRGTSATSTTAATSAASATAATAAIGSGSATGPAGTRGGAAASTPERERGRRSPRRATDTAMPVWPMPQPAPVVARGGAKGRAVATTAARTGVAADAGHAADSAAAVRSAGTQPDAPIPAPAAHRVPGAGADTCAIPAPDATADPAALPATIGELLALRARQRAQQLAYIDRGQRHTWAEVDMATDHLACGLLALGLKTGDRIGVQGVNSIAWLQLFFAAAKIGVAVLGLGLRERGAELSRSLAEAQVRVLFTLREHEGFELLAHVEQLAPGLPRLQHVITLDGAGLNSYASIAATPVDAARLAAARKPVQGSDTALLTLAPAGTPDARGRSGLAAAFPKVLATTQRNLLGRAAERVAKGQVQAADVLLLAQPLGHLHTLSGAALGHLLGGGTVVLAADFQAGPVLQLLQQLPPSTLVAGPSLLAQLAQTAGAEKAELSALRQVFCCGGSVGSAARAWLGARAPRAKLLDAAQAAG